MIDCVYCVSAQGTFWICDACYAIEGAVSWCWCWVRSRPFSAGESSRDRRTRAARSWRRKLKENWSWGAPRRTTTPSRTEICRTPLRKYKNIPIVLCCSRFLTFISFVNKKLEAILRKTIFIFISMTKCFDAYFKLFNNKLWFCRTLSYLLNMNWHFVPLQLKILINKSLSMEFFLWLKNCYQETVFLKPKCSLFRLSSVQDNFVI